MSFRTTLALWSAACLTPWLIGCGGGASTEPTVEIKKSKDDGPASTDTAVTPSTPGETPAAGEYGSISGRVVVNGALPTLPPKVTKGANIKDGEVCAVADIPDKSIMGTDGGLANVFIFLDKAPAGAKAAETSDEKLIFDNKQCQFVPHAMIMQTGRPVAVTNSDPIAHNTHTFPTRNNAFNNLIKINDTVGVDLVYDRPERTPVEVKCDFHNWMLAYHLPLDHPYAAVSAMDGSFEIKDLPAGKHEFRVWHERAPSPGYLERSYEITVAPGENEPIEIEIDAAQLAHNEPLPQPKQVILSFQK
jgi:hypothetical protein